MKQTVFRLAAATLLLIPAALPVQPAAAQSGFASAQEPALPWYRTELIVFRHLRDAPAEDEVFTPPPPPGGQLELMGPHSESSLAMPAWLVPIPLEPATQPGLELVPDDGDGATGSGGSASGAEQDPDGSAYEYRLAALGSLELVDELQRIQGRAFYQVLAHLAWEQPGYAQEQAHPFPLAEFAGIQSGLAGDVTLYLGRYLHLVFDLELEPPVSEQVLFGSRPDAKRAEYRIVEDRKMRSGELHYIDHPKFGVLIKVTEVAVAAEDAGRAQ